MANPLVALSVQGAKPVTAYAQGQQASNQNRLSQLRMAGAEQNLQANQQKMQQQNRLQELLPQAMAGDQGAMNEIAKIDYDLFDQLNENQRAQLQEMNSKAGRLLAWVEGQPPEKKAQAYQMARERAVSLGYPAEQIPERYDPNWVGAQVSQAREIEDMLGAGKNTPYGKNLIEAVDANGNPVFVQATGEGGYQIQEGIRPPESVAERKYQDEQESGEIDAGAAAAGIRAQVEKFKSTLTDPDINDAIGIKGAVLGQIGRLSGNQAGVLSARISRQVPRIIADIKDKFPGVLSDTDIKLLQSSMPAKTDAPEIWVDWFNRDFLPEMESKFIKKTGQSLNLEPIPMNLGGPSSSSQQIDSDLKSLIKQAENL